MFGPCRDRGLGGRVEREPTKSILTTARLHTLTTQATRYRCGRIRPSPSVEQASKTLWICVTCYEVYPSGLDCIPVWNDWPVAREKWAFFGRDRPRHGSAYKREFLRVRQPCRRTYGQRGVTIAGRNPIV